MNWEKELKDYTYYIKLEKRLSDNTVEAYLRDLKQLATFMWDHFSLRKPEKVHAEHIEAFLGALYERGIQKNSQARILSGIKSFFNYLLINDRIEELPTEFIDAPKAGRKLPQVLSVEEIEAILSTFDLSTPQGHRNKAIIETLYSCGLRVTELITLRISDLFFQEGIIRVIGKGDKQRLVPVSEVAMRLINFYLEQRQHLEVDPRHRDILFLNNRGRGLSRVMIFHMVREATLQAGIDREVSPHTFRHSFATHLLEGGANIRQVQQMLGHESILTTEIYTHLNMQELRSNLERFHPLSKK